MVLNAIHSGNRNANLERLIIYGNKKGAEIAPFLIKFVKCTSAKLKYYIICY